MIKAGPGNDVIGGGSRTCSGLTAANGDVLQGEAGNDEFYVPAYDCFAALSGGPGDNTANFSGRSAGVHMSNDGMANDGEGDERINIAADILRLIGGFGNDTLVGGAKNDVLIGGPGGDVLNGGAGTDDLVDYSMYDVATNISLCFTATLQECGPANDGANEADQVYWVEHVIGGSAVDTISVLNYAAVNTTLEGKDGDDRLTGGAGHDILWGDDGADTLRGGDGDDQLTGGAGVDVLEAGEGSGDICVPDALDAPAPTGCEL